MQNGTVISGKKIDTPNKFSTACNITTQIIAKVASSQFGGQTITLSHLAPFVQRSRDKFRKKVREEYAAIGLHLSDEQVNTIAEMRVNDDIEQGVQTLQYQILTLMTCNGQSPFVTVFMYLNEVTDPQTRTDLKTVIKEVLRQRIIGVKNEKGVYVSPAFPKLIYVTDEDNIRPGTPDWDVTYLAAQCTAKRMVPDYISAKKCKELKEGNVFPCMGCVDGDEVITYKLLNNLYVESFSRMWNRVSLLFKVKLQHKGDPHLYMDVEGVEIYDKENGFVEVKRVIKNLSSDWVRITFSNGRMLQCTTDHPLPVVGKGRTFVRDLNIGDRVPLVKSQFTDESFEMDPEFAWALGVIVCDGCYDRQMNVTIAMEGEDEIADALESVLKKVYGSEMILKEWHRGKKGDYKELRFSNRIRMEQDMKELFGGTPKKERQIPNVIFRTNLETRLSFLGGLIDADGYINASGTISTIQLGSTNKELALQQMMLMQSCGINARMYKNYYKKGSSKIRYRVEGDAIPELAQYIKCEKKRSNIKNTDRTNKSNVTDDDASITSIEYLDGAIDWSYDVTTESDYFDVSGIYSHNCRSFLHPWYDEDGNPKFYGRFNVGVTTINLVDVALSSNKDFDKFWDILDERLGLCKEALLLRHKKLRGTPSDVAPELWKYGAMARLKSGETIDKLLFNGYSSISLGYAGLYECVYYMTGYSHTDKEHGGYDFAMQVMKHLNGAAENWKEETTIGFGIYGTPIESTTYRFAKLLKKRFGIVEGVTDRDYITNSYHVHVSEKIDAFSKITFEAPFQELSTGGAISYVEIPNLEKNIPAIIAVMQHMYENTLYAEFNTRSDVCQKCNFEGEIQIVEDEDGKLVWECPQCGNRDENTMNVTRRTCGYLGENFWNQGRTQEIYDRVLHL